VTVLVRMTGSCHVAGRTSSWNRTRRPSVVAPLRTQLGDCFDHHNAAAVEIAQQHVELASVNSAREAAL